MVNRLILNQRFVLKMKVRSCTSIRNSEKGVFHLCGLENYLSFRC